MCPSGKGLDPALDECTDQLKARHRLFGRGSYLPDLLHQGLRNRHFFFGQLVRLRCPGPKGVGGTKFFKPELQAGGRLVFGVKPPRSPAMIVLGHPQLEVFNLGAHRVIGQRCLIFR
jgi:hypothetical protein